MLINISVFTINWPKQGIFLSATYHFRVCFQTVQQLHAIMNTYVIILLQHWIHECYNQITKLAGMVGGLKPNWTIM